MSSSRFTFPFWHNQRDIISTLRWCLVEKQTNRFQLIKGRLEARQEKGESYKFIHFRDVGLNVIMTESVYHNTLDIRRGKSALFPMRLPQ